jgi:hypothetical protein
MKSDVIDEISQYVELDRESLLERGGGHCAQG